MKSQQNSVINNYRRSSRNLSTILILGIILVIFYAEYTSYKSQKKILEEDTSIKLESIAKSIALNFPVEDYQALLTSKTNKDDITSNTENEYYQNIYRHLNDYAATHELKTNIYTLTKNENDDFEFIVSSNNPFYRHVFMQPHKVLVEHYTKGARLKEYTTENGNWISAFTPIKDKAGKTIGVIQVDEAAMHFHEKAKSILFCNMYTVLIGLAALVIFIIFYMRRSIKSMFKLTKTLDNEVQVRNEELKVINEKLIEINNNLEAKIAENVAELSEKNNELLQKNEDLTKFASVASHDMKEPLRTITSYAQLAKRKVKHDKTSSELLGFIEDASRRMQILLSDLLDYTKAGINPTDFEPVDLNEVMIISKANLQSRIKETKAIITINNTLSHVKGKRTLIVQIIQNIISNALKYQPTGKQPIIEISELIDTENNISHLSITDNGLGIPDDKLQEIFEPFRRLHTRSEYEGTGVGLATVKRIVEKLGGEIHVVSQEGKGSTFLVSLPILKQETKEILAKEKLQNGRTPSTNNLL